jgi:hypothetical protein
VRHTDGWTRAEKASRHVLVSIRVPTPSLGGGTAS